jgi:hypothetical protein
MNPQLIRNRLINYPQTTSIFIVSKNPQPIRNRRQPYPQLRHFQIPILRLWIRKAPTEFRQMESRLCTTKKEIRLYGQFRESDKLNLLSEVSKKTGIVIKKNLEGLGYGE